MSKISLLSRDVTWRMCYQDTNKTSEDARFDRIYKEWNTELSYQKGKVIALGIYADDIITNNKFDKYFDNLLLRYAL